MLIICFGLINSHTNNIKPYFKLLFKFTKKKLFETFTEKFQTLCEPSFNYMKFVLNILPEITQQPYAKYFYNHGVINH